MKLNNKFIMSIIRQVNPLELPDEDGNGKVFNTLQDCYVYVMDKSYQMCKSGYVDLYIIISGLYNCKFSVSSQIYRQHMKKPVGVRYRLMDLGCNEARGFFRKFLSALHEMTGTDFELFSFENAYEIHMKHVKSYKLKLK